MSNPVSPNWQTFEYGFPSQDGVFWCEIDTGRPIDRFIYRALAYVAHKGGFMWKPDYSLAKRNTQSSEHYEITRYFRLPTPLA